jgi:sugar O-acyltransferase (sialic acid O-acetyltransferase NeuD family)
MAELKRVILVGGFEEVIELAEGCGYTVEGIIEKKPADSFRGYPILGRDEDAAALFARYGDIPLVITPDMPHKRQSLQQIYQELGWRFASLIHPRAEIARSARLGKGVLIQYGANISADVHIGDFVRINTYANIMHDSTVDDFSTVAPNTVVLGRVKIGRYCYIGANATILSDRTIGEGALVGAAAIVTRDVQPGRTVAGNPAREIR